MEKLIVLIFCHLIGDYVLQGDYLATNKGNNWYILFVHCALYSLPFYIVFGFVWQLAIIFITHMVIDASKARYNILSYTEDQYMHYGITLIYFL